MIIRKIIPYVCGGGWKSASGSMLRAWRPASRNGMKHTQGHAPPDLTFVYTTNCKSVINDTHHEKRVWISRASEPLRIHIYKILLQQ